MRAARMGSKSEDNDYADGWVQTYPTDTEPAFNVDWCDAYMCCQWAGKHLCGAVGGGAIASAGDMNDPEKSEWYNACSSGGEYRYPYGDVYDPQACNTYDYAGVVPRPLTSGRLAGKSGAALVDSSTVGGLVGTASGLLGGAAVGLSPPDPSSSTPPVGDYVLLSYTDHPKGPSKDRTRCSA